MGQAEEIIHALPRNRRRALPRVMAGFLIVAGLQKVGPLLAIALLGRSVGSEAVGAFGLWLGIAGMAQILAGGNLASAIQLGAARRPSGWPPSPQLSNISFASSIIAAAALAAGLFMGAVAGYELDPWPQTLLLVAALPFAVASLNGFAFQRGSGKPALSVVAASVQTAAPPLLVLAFVSLDFQPRTISIAAVAAYLASPSLVFLARRPPSGSDKSARRQDRLAGPMKYALPFIPHVMATTANSHVDKWLIVVVLGLAESADYFIIFFLLQLPVILGQVMTDGLFYRWIKHEVPEGKGGGLGPEHARLATVYGVVATGACLLLVLARGVLEDIFNFSLTGSNGAVFCYLAAAAIINTVYLSVHLEVARSARSGALMWSGVIALAVNVPLALLLISRFGVAGVAASTAVATLIKLYVAGALTYGHARSLRVSARAACLGAAAAAVLRAILGAPLS